MNNHTRSPARPRRHGSRADVEAEEIDEVESLQHDAEHDEDERDPDPERYGAQSDHAQEKGQHRQSGMTRDRRPA